MSQIFQVDILVDISAGKCWSYIFFSIFFLFVYASHWERLLLKKKKGNAVFSSTKMEPLPNVTNLFYPSDISAGGVKGNTPDALQ